MLWRHLYLVRAGLAAGLVSGLMFIGASTATAQTKPPAAADSEPSSGPIGVATETVNLLHASKAGDLDVVARGQGQERVHLSIRNRSTRRLNVIIPPGLVAASSAGQAGGGGRAAAAACRAWGWAPPPIERERSATSGAPPAPTGYSRSGPSIEPRSR